MNIQSGYLEVDGGRIYYEEAGQGPAFVMVHAGVADRRMWDEQFAFFAERSQGPFRVIRFDMRGYGLSPITEKPYSDRADLAALLDHLGVDRAVLMGCSWGGMATIDFAIEHPEKVIALIPVAAGLSGFPYRDEPMPYTEELEAALEQGQYELAAEYQARIWFDGLQRTADQMDPAVRAHMLAMCMTGIRTPEDPDRYLFLTPPAIERIDGLQTPMLVIAGDLDVPDILHIADLLSSTVPGARKVILENTAHLPNLERPEDFNRVVAAFLDGVVFNRI